MQLQTKRIYEMAGDGDGKRLLVDRLWPRGVSKERAKLDGWLKDIAPSTKLREWFGHEADKFDVFRARYRTELATDPAKQAAVAQMLEIAKTGPVILLYSAKSPTVNHAVVLKEYLDEAAAKG